MTKYVVLRQALIGGASAPAWILENPGIEAHSPKGAIRKHILTGMSMDEAAGEVENHEAQANYGEFVAVAQRYWRPEPTALDVQIRLKIG